jgi:hypothetical protein
VHGVAGFCPAMNRNGGIVSGVRGNYWEIAEISVRGRKDCTAGSFPKIKKYGQKGGFSSMMSFEKANWNELVLIKICSVSMYRINLCLINKNALSLLIIFRK